MTKKRKDKKPRTERLFSNHPLIYPYRRGKVARPKLEAIFIHHGGGAAFSDFAQNWIGAGLFAATLRGVFESDEPRFEEARQMLKDLGIRKKPRQIHFDTLALIERYVPNLVSCEELMSELDIEKEELDEVLRYLRSFVLVMCGVCVLRDGQGYVGIADAGLWMAWQNRMSVLDSGIGKSRKRHGLTKKNLKHHHLKQTEELPHVRPALLEMEA